MIRPGLRLRIGNEAYGHDSRARSRCYARLVTFRTPLPLRLKTTRRSALLLLLGCGVFVVGGLVLLPSRPLEAYPAIVFFGLGVVVAAIQLLPNSSYLELDTRGFTTCTLFRRSFMHWTDVGEFFPYELPIQGRRRSLVAFRLAPGYEKQAGARKFLTRLAGIEAALPDTYGRSPKELAELLNKIRSEQVGLATREWAT